MNFEADLLRDLKIRPTLDLSQKRHVDARPDVVQQNL